MDETGAPRRAVVAWSLYDWANSAFTTLVITFVYGTYFTKAIAPDELTGTTQWAWMMGLGGIAIALLSPVIGASADRRRRRRAYLMAATWLCVGCTAAVAFVSPGMEQAVLYALGLVFLANVAFEVGMVLYNSFLPSLAPAARMGRVSGYGWACGYLGGLLCLALALVVLVRSDPLFGISTDAGFNYRATNLLVAGWLFVFSIPMFLWVREPAGRERSAGPGVFAELADTFRKIRAHRDVVRFLIARLIYNDGLVTVFAFGGIYAAGTFGLTLDEVILFGIVLNVAAGIGAWVFGFVDDRLGAKTTIMVSLAALTGFTAMAALAPSVFWLWVAGVGIGIFVGPNQSASRSLMSRLTPPAQAGEFFGFFAFSGKVTAFIGPFLLGGVTALAQSQRAGVATIIGFFAIGAYVLAGLKERTDPTG